jgi:hypothetical protein
MDALEKLRAEQMRLEARLREIESVLRAHQELQLRAERLLLPDAPHVVSTSPTNTTILTGGDARRGRSRSPEVEEFETAVREILRDAKEPMDRHALYESLVSRGLVIEGKDPKNTLGARMTRMKDVINQRGQGYWLASREAELTESSDDAVSKTVSDAPSDLLG